MITNGSFRSLTKYFIFNVERFDFMSRTCLGTIAQFLCMYFFNVGILTVFKWTCLDYTCFNNGSSRLSEETSRERTSHRSLENETFFFHLAKCSRHPWWRVSRSLLNGFWKKLDSCPTCNRRACSEPNSLVHSCSKEIFGGGWGDMYTFSYMTSPVFIRTTFCKEYTSYYRELATETVQMQHWGQAWDKPHQQQVQWHEHEHAQDAQHLSMNASAHLVTLLMLGHMHLVAQGVPESFHTHPHGHPCASLLEFTFLRLYFDLSFTILSLFFTLMHLE